MNLAVISNNYGQRYDGIGAFAKKVYSLLPDAELSIFSGKCKGDASVLTKVLTREMFNAILAAKKECASGLIDCVIIEYPFVEWNPLALWAIARLKRVMGRRGIPLVVSVHEYRRLNPLRRIAVRLISSLADGLLVTTDQMGRDLEDCSPRYEVRAIPSNIKVDLSDSHEGRSPDYSFFGLINDSKAFEPMIEAWKQGKPENSVLNIITASDVDRSMTDDPSICLHSNASDDDVVRILRHSKACILPIIPMVDQKNTTFSTAILCGCICMGIFCDEYKNLPFVVNMDDYSVQDFCEAIDDIESLTQSETSELHREARCYGMAGQSHESVAAQICAFIKSL